MPLLVFMSVIKVDSTLKTHIFYFFYMYALNGNNSAYFNEFAITIETHHFFSNRFMSYLMLPACLLDMKLVLNKFATEKLLEISF